MLEHSAKRSSKPPIHVIYLITGVSRDATNEKVHKLVEFIINTS